MSDRDQGVTGEASVEEMLDMASMARRYYFEGKTRVEIAQEFGVSRFRVARLLDQAQREGIVRIEVTLPEAMDADISLRLRKHFGLDRAIVVRPDGADAESVRSAIGRAAAHLLTDLVTADDVVGVTSGRTVDAMVGHLSELPPCEVTQLTGMSGDLNLNSVETVHGLARGQSHTIYAPLVLDSPATAQALRSDAVIGQTIAQFARVTIAFVAVGSWAPPDSRFYDQLPAELRDRLVGAGVRADIAGALVDADGQPVDALADRVIGIDLDGLRRIPTVIAVAGGMRKVAALKAALNSGAIDGVVTDVAAAEALLAQ